MEEVEKAKEQDSVSSTKQKGEENPKVEDSSSLEPTTLKAEDVEDKKIEPLVAEAPNTADAPEVSAPPADSDSFSSTKENEEEKPKVESLPSPAIPLPTSGNIDDKPTEPPAVEVQKAADAPLVEIHSLSSTEEDEKEKPKAEDSPSPAIPPSKLGDTEDKLIEPPPVVKIEKVANDPALEVPLVESHGISSTKEHEEENPKVEDSTTAATPSPNPVVEFVKTADAPFVEQSSDSSAKESGQEENTKVENSQTPKTLTPESGGAEEKLVEPTVAEVEKIVDATVSDVQLVDQTTKEKEHIIDSTTTSASEPVADLVKEKAEDSRIKEESKEILEKGQEEEPKTVDVNDSSVETIDKLKEPLEPSPVEEPEPTVVQVIEDSKLGSKAAEKQEPEIAEVEKKPEEPLELTEQVDKKVVNVEPQESVEDKTIKDDKSLADKVEHSTSLEVVETVKDVSPSPIESSEASIDQKAENNPVVTEAVVGEEEKKEVIRVDVVKETSKEVSLETGKIGEEDAAEKQNVISEDSAQLLKEDDVNRAIPKEEVADNSFQEAQKDVEPTEENKVAEHSRDETPTSAETNKDVNVEGKQDVVSTAVHEPPEESQKPEAEVKEEEDVKTEAEKLEKVDDIAKSDQNPEPETVTKDVENTKTSQDLSKETPTKPTQKQSNNIISKVKQSLVKAKKAIIGKSPNSKTPASEAKGDIKVK